MIKRTLYFGNPAYLSLKDKQLLVKKPDDSSYRATVPVEDIAIVVLDNYQITITNQLIEALQNNTAAIISCDSSHLPSSIMLPMAGNNTTTERMRLQMEVTIPLKKQLWKQTVEQKLKNQSAVLKSIGKETKRFDYLIDRIEPGDVTNVEGRAAAYYWKELFDDKFIRDQNGASPNKHLNYAYSVIRAIVARGLVSSGMHPAFGIFHSNKYNAYCLADDIMEPYRPFADQIVYNMYSNGEISSNNLETNQKASLLKVATADVILDNKKSPLMVAVSRTTNSLFECYAVAKRKILYPSFNEF